MNTFREFEKFVLKEKDELSLINGDCKHCPKKNACLSANKESIICSIESLEKSDTRFPLLLSFVKKYKRALKLVPSSVYKSVYGWYTDILSCPFYAYKVVENLDKIELVYNMLSDDLSKKNFLNVLMYRITFDRKFILDTISEESQYFISEFSDLGCNEVFVDCGAFTGDTLERFLEHNAMPKKCYLFEPDTNNAQKLKNVIKDKNMEDRCVVIGKGVYEYSTKLWFVSGKESESYFSTEETDGAEAIDVTSIDDSVEDAITFIKMDIEGFEKSALRGAKNQMVQNKPKLAICVYHSIEDLWEIPLMINELGVYKNFKIRHYTDNFRESVFYAF